MTNSLVSDVESYKNGAFVVHETQKNKDFELVLTKMRLKIKFSA
jgi:hypothetical protein